MPGCIIIIKLILIVSVYPLMLGAQNSGIRKIDSLKIVLKNAREDTGKINTLIALSFQYWDTGNLGIGRETAHSAIQLADKIGNRKGKARGIHMDGLFDVKADSLGDALEKFKRALAVFEEIKDWTSAANELSSIGNIHLSRGETPMAIKYYNSAYNAYEKAGDQPGMGRVYVNLGVTFQNLGNYAEALKFHFKALQYGNDHSKAGISYLNIGSVYFDMLNYPEALKNWKISLEIFTKNGNRSGVAGIYVRMGMVYSRQGQYEQALENYTAAEKLFKEINEMTHLADVYTRIGRLNLDQNKPLEAKKRFHDALDLLYKIKSDFPDVTATAFIHLGHAMLKIARQENNSNIKKLHYKDALSNLDSGLVILKNSTNPEILRDAYRIYSEVYSEMNDYENAIRYNNLYTATKDSILSNETIRKAEQYRTQYEVDKAVVEEKLQQEKVLAARRKKMEVVILGLSILALGGIFSSILIRQRNLKKRAVEKAEAGHKMAELELQSLRAQLNPHFMFNSLNAIQDLILKEDNDRSHLYLSRFAKLLRLLLDNANQPFVSIKQEMEFLELYLSLENLRIPNLQFSVKKDAGIDVEERMIPNMMLQPYIENAIWHGLSHKKGDRKLELRIHQNDQLTEFEIEDNGVGRKKAEEMKSLYRKGHHSKGMELLSKRFNLISTEYGSAIQTNIIDLSDNGEAIGTIVKIDVPINLSLQAQKLINDQDHHS